MPARPTAAAICLHATLMDDRTVASSVSTLPLRSSCGRAGSENTGGSVRVHPRAPIVFAAVAVPAMRHAVGATLQVDCCRAARAACMQAKWMPARPGVARQAAPRWLSCAPTHREQPGVERVQLKLATLLGLGGRRGSGDGSSLRACIRAGGDQGAGNAATGGRAAQSKVTCSKTQSVPRHRQCAAARSAGRIPANLPAPRRRNGRRPEHRRPRKHRGGSSERSQG